MHPFKIYNANSAQTESAEILNALEETIGFVPNIFAVIAESTPALKAFTTLNEQFAATGFNATSRELIQTAASVENSCNYCVAGHTAFAEMQQVTDDIINAVRNNIPINDEKLETLNQFTRSLVEKRGMVSHEELQHFLDTGFTPSQAIEVVLGICVKMFSNLANNMIGIPLDDEFTPFTWSPEKLKLTSTN